jgi:5-methylcytosine-specific restriction protein A
MSNAHRRRGRRWRELRLEVLARDDWTCRLRIAGVCTDRATTVDHVIPIRAWPDGELVPSNLLAACRPCNGRKSDKVTAWRGKPPGEIDPWSL